jgi:hypothetical protein
MDWFAILSTMATGNSGLKTGGTDPCCELLCSEIPLRLHQKMNSTNSLDQKAMGETLRENLSDVGLWMDL